VFQTLRTALKLAGTVVELNERLTALEANFDILDRAVKRESARVRAENSRARRAEIEPEVSIEADATIKPLGGIMKRKLESGR